MFFTCCVEFLPELYELAGGPFRYGLLFNPFRDVKENSIEGGHGY